MWGSLENLSPPSWEPKRGRTVAVEEEQDFVSAGPYSNYYLGPHLWPWKAWLFSAALLFSPTCNSTDILPKKLNITQAVTDRAQLSQSAKGLEDRQVQETWLLLLQVVENKHSCAPEKGLFFSHLQYWMGWGKFRSNNLVVAFLLPGAKRWFKWKKKLREKEKAEKNQEKSRLIAVWREHKYVASPSLPRRTFHRGVNHSNRCVACEVIWGRN